MKKVRYALGALGAVPALGLAAPAATATTHAPPTVKGRHGAQVPAITTCNARHLGNYTYGMSGNIVYSRYNGCIGEAWGRIFIQPPPTGLWMRVKFYANGAAFKTNMNKNGHIGHSSIHWSSNPFVKGVQQVCEAVVPSTAPSRVLYGPVCEPTGY
jgi:hypothetical protein